MAITTISSRELNQDTASAKRAARKGPVFITDRGRPAHVLMTIKQYEKLTGKQKSIVEMLAMPEVAEIDFEPPRLGDEYPIPVDLS